MCCYCRYCLACTPIQFCFYIPWLPDSCNGTNVPNVPCLIQTPLPLSSGSLAISEYYPLLFVKLIFFSLIPYSPLNAPLFVFFSLLKNLLLTFGHGLIVSTSHITQFRCFSNQATEIALVKIKNYFCVTLSNDSFLMMPYLTSQKNFSCLTFLS